MTDTFGDLDDFQSIKNLTTKIIRQKLQLLASDSVSAQEQKLAIDVIGCVSQCHEKVFGKRDDAAGGKKTKLGEVAHLIEGDAFERKDE